MEAEQIMIGHLQKAMKFRVMSRSSCPFAYGQKTSFTSVEGKA